MSEESTPQHPPRIQRWGRREVPGSSVSRPAVLAAATASSMAPPPPGSPQPEPLVSHAPASRDGSLHIRDEVCSTPVAKAHGDSPHTIVLPDPTGAPVDGLPNFATPTPTTLTTIEPDELAAPAKPVAALAGLYDSWEPVPATVVEPVAESPADPVLASADSAKRAKFAKRATAMMVFCAVAILAIIVASAVRLAGFSGPGLPADELSGRYVRELLLWVPLIALFATGLTASALVRTRQMGDGSRIAR